MSKVFVIDPGHGGSDPGACNGSRREADDNLRLSLAVRDKLTAKGHTVILTRTGEANITMAARAAMAKDAKADFFISLHRNSFGDQSARGVEIWARYKQHVSAASEVLEAVAKAPIQANRGIKVGDYAVLYGLTMPAMLLEMGFISNPKDNMLFDDNLDVYATAIAKGMLSALGEPWDDSDAKPYIYVQVGAFSVKSNAEAFLARVRAMGLDAFLVQPDDKK